MIPAAGFAHRLPELNGSKEVFPLSETGEPVMGHALRNLARANIQDVIVVLRPEKKDIREVLGRGDDWGVTLEYIDTEATQGPAQTIDKAYHRIQGVTVALAFPDILMESTDPYTPLLERMRGGEANGVLGLFPQSPLQPADPVRLTPEGAVSEILPKNSLPPGPWCWGAAVWSSAVSDFFHEQVAKGPSPPPTLEGDWGLGQLLQRALEAGFPLGALPVAEVPFLDIGTPEGLGWANQGMRSPPTSGP